LLKTNLFEIDAVHIKNSKLFVRNYQDFNSVRIK